MNDAELVSAYVRYFLEGAEEDEWAPVELSQLAIDQPERAWRFIGLINATHIEGEVWRGSVHAALGCGALEELIALHEDEMLPIILRAAGKDPVIRTELATIYATSISPSASAQIRAVLAQQRGPANPAKPGG